MWTISTLDIVMFVAIALIFACFTGSLAWSLAKEKIRVLTKGFEESSANIKSFYKTREGVYVDSISKLSLQLAGYDHLYDETRKYKERLEDWAVCSFIDPKQPAAALIQAIVDYEVKLALDPAVSKQANSLVNKAKRAFGKKLRDKHERELARLEKEWERCAEVHRLVVSKLRTQLVDANFDHNLFVAAVDETMEAKMALPGVRHSFRLALNTNVEAKRKQVAQ